MALGGVLAGIGAVGNILGSGSSQKTSSTQSGTERFSRGTVSVDDLLNQMLGNPNLGRSASDIQDTSLQRAEGAVGGVVESIFSDYRSDFLPEVFQASESAGVFGSSGAQQLADRGFSDAVSRSAELTLGTANTFSNQLLQEQQMMQQFITQLFGIDLEESGTSSSTGTGTSRTTGRNPIDFTGLTSLAIDSFAPSPTRE